MFCLFENWQLMLPHRSESERDLRWKLKTHKNRSQTWAIKFCFLLLSAVLRASKKKFIQWLLFSFSSVYAFSEKTWIAYESYIWTNHMVTALFLQGNIVSVFSALFMYINTFFIVAPRLIVWLAILFLRDICNNSFFSRLGNKM